MSATTTVRPFGSDIEVVISPTNDDAPGWILVKVRDLYHRTGLNFILNEDEAAAVARGLEQAMAASYKVPTA